jgi:hypothetical protein
MDLKKKIDDDSDKTDPQLIGSLIYHAVNVPSHFMSQPR